MATVEKHFDEELRELKEKLALMGSHAESAVSRAVRAMQERDAALALQVQKDDDLIDRLEIEIDDLSINLLTKAPLASDLRLVMVAMKISQDLERIGDQGTTISRRAIELTREPQLPRPIDIPGVAAIALQMLRDSLDSFALKDPARARAVISRDPEVDGLDRKFQGELSGMMAEDRSLVGTCLHLMTISKSIERIGDHATNIAEEVVYYCEARDVRHNHDAVQT